MLEYAENTARHDLADEFKSDVIDEVASDVRGAALCLHSIAEGDGPAEVEQLKLLGDVLMIASDALATLAD